MTSLGTTEFFVVSVDLQWSISGHTVGEGPVIFGIANDDLNAAEIAEALDASPQSMADIVARERARRPVRLVGAFTGQTPASQFNDGRVKRTKLKTMLANSVEIAAWWRNESGSALTTGTTVDVFGKVYGYWA